MSPVGQYGDFAACVAAQRSKGHDEESARRICGAIEQRMREEARLDEAHTGAMIALYVPDEAARAIAFEGGEPAADLHVTLLYLGPAADLLPPREDWERALREFAARQGPIEGRVSGTGRFNGDGERDPFYASADVPGLQMFVTELMYAMPGECVGEHGLDPHVTLAYLPHDAPTPEIRLPEVALRFEAISFVAADDRVDFPLGGADAEELTRAYEAVSAWMSRQMVLRRLRALDPYELRLTRDMERAFRSQSRLFLGLLARQRGLASGRVAEGPFDWLAEWAEVERLTRRFLEHAYDVTGSAAFLAGARETIDQLGMSISFDLKNPRAVAYLRDHAAEQVTRVNAATRGEIARLVTDGLDRGASTEEIAREIKRKFSEFSTPQPQLHIRNRAHLVAVTETAEAYSAGTQAFAQSMADRGHEIEVAWLTAEDDRVDEVICGPNGDEGWIALGDTFQSGDQRPPGHPACRCSLLTRVAGTASALD